VVCDDLDIPKYAMFAVPKKDMRMKDKADLLEAFIGALYVDKDLVSFYFFTVVNK
jgi:ribonuclease-3